MRCAPTIVTSLPDCYRSHWARQSTTSRWTCCSARRLSAVAADAAAESSIPDTVNIAIIGAGIAGISVALVAAEEGVSYQIFDRNEEVGGTSLTTTYPESASIRLRRTTHCPLK